MVTIVLLLASRAVKDILFVTSTLQVIKYYWSLTTFYFQVNTSLLVRESHLSTENSGSLFVDKIITDSAPSIINLQLNSSLNSTCKAISIANSVVLGLNCISLISAFKCFHRDPVVLPWDGDHRIIRLLFFKSIPFQYVLYRLFLFFG